MPCNCINNIQNTFCLNCNSQVLDSCFFRPNAGVLQGESLSPTIFSFFLNDLNDYLKEDQNIGVSLYHFYLVLLLFADDMVLFSDNRFSLQAGLIKLYDYCNKWGLLVNVNKTKCLVFKNGGRKSVLDKWYYNREEIETVTSLNILASFFQAPVLLVEVLIT